MSIIQQSHGSSNFSFYFISLRSLILCNMPQMFPLGTVIFIFHDIFFYLEITHHFLLYSLSKLPRTIVFPMITFVQYSISVWAPVMLLHINTKLSFLQICSLIWYVCMIFFYSIIDKYLSFICVLILFSVLVVELRALLCFESALPLRNIPRLPVKF